jgi:hypothetical protein
LTPVIEKIRHDLGNRYVFLDHYKLTRFMMARASNHDLEIINCRGQRISAGLGFAFEDSLRSQFWTFIRPCLEDSIQESCDAVEKVLPEYSRTDRMASLDSLQAALNGFIERIYRRMIELDRLMRGKGNPSSVKPYDATPEIKSAHELIAHKVAILKRHYLRPVTREFWDKHKLWIIGSLAIPLLVALIKALAG